MPLPKDWRAFIESLNSNGVEYLIVGTVALASKYGVSSMCAGELHTAFLLSNQSCPEMPI